MRVAIACKDGEINERFRPCQYYAVYEYEGADFDSCTKRLIDSSSAKNDDDMVQLMRNNHIDAVVAGNIGVEAKSLLLSGGIVPVSGYSGDTDSAADLLITGQLPADSGNQGGCSCGCGSCCGGCGEDGDCGCGGHDDGDCGCGCHD
ncbi:MAG: NifB/NifX family molybdenum-iron cluster-binding protein [Candidatus Limivicinus sp.]|jgi:predicted Fe-Mo cluster-binding NifX family protein